MVAVLDRIGVQSPRIRSVPSYVSSAGPDAIEIMTSCRKDLDVWQEDALTDALGFREDGKLAAFEFATCIARQNGKGGLLEARELAGVFTLGERLIIHSSHEFATSMVAMDRMEELLEDGGLISELRPRGGISRSHGAEGFRFRNGARIWYRTRTKGSGRGFSADLVILDEAMIIQESFHGALFPIVSARTVKGNPQIWYTGSAVDQMVHEHGVVFARVRERGLRGDDPSLGYLEWSAVCYDDDGEEVPLAQLPAEFLADPENWMEANPAVGIRISFEAVANELRSMHDRMFPVERLTIGDWPATHTVNGEVILLDDWNALIDGSSVLTDPVCFAFDVKPDRSQASIAVAGSRKDGLKHLELVDRRPGTGWVADRLIELQQRWKSVGVVCDPYGPAGSLVQAIEALGVPVRSVTAGEHAAACGNLYDLVDQSRLRHLGQGELAAAIKAAKQRPLGEKWAWSRKGGVDISPLVSATLALWGSATLIPEPRKFAGVAFG